MRRTLLGAAVLAVLVPTPASAREQASVEGVVQPVVSERFDGRSMEPVVVVKTRAGLLRSVSSAAASRRARPGDRVRIRGSSVRVLERGSGRSGAHAHAAAATGPRRILVVRVSFPERANAFSEATLRSRILTGAESTDAYLREVSNGASGLTGVKDPEGDLTSVTTTTGGGSCATTAWRSEIAAAVRAKGFDPAAYQHLTYIIPDASGCSWQGQAAVGGSWAFVEDGGLTTVAHELGHNLGFPHAASRRCTLNGTYVMVSDSCTTSTYGDLFDVMGRSANERHYNGRSLAQRGWIDPTQVQDVTASGTYALVPVATTGAGTRLLRVRRSDGKIYFLELRRPSGVFDDFALTDPVVTGVSVRLGELSGYSVTNLLDANPQTSSMTDAALAAGRSFTDSVRRITVSVASVSSTGASVRVTFG